MKHIAPPELLAELQEISAPGSEMEVQQGSEAPDVTGEVSHTANLHTFKDITVISPVPESSKDRDCTADRPEDSREFKRLAFNAEVDASSRMWKYWGYKSDPKSAMVPDLGFDILERTRHRMCRNCRRE